MSVVIPYQPFKAGAIRVQFPRFGICVNLVSFRFCLTDTHAKLMLKPPTLVSVSVCAFISFYASINIVIELIIMTYTHVFMTQYLYQLDAEISNPCLGIGLCRISLCQILYRF